MGYQLCMVQADARVYQSMQQEIESRNEFQLACLPTAEELFLKLQSGYTPDVIILDQRLPDMDAPRICRLLSQMRAYHDIPLIVINQNQAEADASLMPKGAFDALSFPLQFEAFRERLYDAISARQENLKIRALFEKGQQARANSNPNLLSGLPGQRVFQRYLQAECKAAVMDIAPLSLLLIDVDFLGAYNEAFGEAAGDAFICRLGALLPRVAPKAQCFQIEDDGFAIVQRYLQREDALKMGERLCQRVKLFDIKHAAVTALSHLSVSVGTATVQSPAEGSCQLLYEAAGQALFQAKTWGRAQTRQYFAL